MADISGLGFNANDVEPNEGFDLLPDGEYDAIIVASEIKKTTAGTGSYLSLELQVLNGKYQNRKIWDNLNILNPSEKAQQIARGTLSAICRAVNVLTPKDTAELHNKPLRISVKIEKSTGYNDKNVVKAYKPRQSGPVSAPVMQQKAAVGPPAETPWG
jgi:hypothetical protein